MTEEDELLPRVDEPVEPLSMVAEEQTAFEPAPRERALLLTNRKVRDRLFRRACSTPTTAAAR